MREQHDCQSPAAQARGLVQLPDSAQVREDRRAWGVKPASPSFTLSNFSWLLTAAAAFLACARRAPARVSVAVR